VVVLQGKYTTLPDRKKIFPLKVLLEKHQEGNPQNCGHSTNKTKHGLAVYD
jgi:hypothetical protein